MADWIAVDWPCAGGTAPRAWAIGPEGPLAEATLDLQGNEAFGDALLRLVEPWLDDATDVIVAGAADPSAARPVPCPPLDRPVVAAAPDPRMRLHLVPGLRQNRPTPDLTQGAEVRIAGLIAAEPQFDGILCLPGPHTTWAHLSAGEVVSFQTFLTGSLLPLLSDEAPSATVGEDFLQAAEEARSRPERLAARLAQVRAEQLLGSLDEDAAQSRRAGLLIGAELAAARPWWLGQQVVVAGPSPLAEQYLAALAAQGVTARPRAESELVLAGLVRARTLLKGNA